MNASYDDRLARRLSFVKEVSLFSHLNAEDLEILTNDLRFREYKKNEFIFHQGDESREIYIVLDGKVRIFRTTPTGNETSVNLYSTYDLIGEFAAIDNQSRSASAIAVEDCALLQMMWKDFSQHLAAMPQLTQNMIHLLINKLRWTTNYAETIAQYDIAGRLLHILLIYKEQFGTEIETGKRYEVNLALNQAELASLVGARRERINRILRGWRERDLIEYDSGKITILDLPRVIAERDSRLEANFNEDKW